MAFNSFSPEEVRYLKDHAGLLPIKTIAQHMRRTSKSVYRKAYTLAIPTQYLGISKQEVEWIMELTKGGMPVAEIGSKFGLPTYSLKLFIEFRRREQPWP